MPMLPGVLLVTLAALVAAAEAGAAAAVEAGEAAWTDSSTRAVPAGLTLLAMSSLIGRQVCRDFLAFSLVSSVSSATMSE